MIRIPLRHRRFVFGICLVYGCLVSIAGLAQTRHGDAGADSHSVDSSIARLPIRVIDKNGNPVAGAEVQVWGRENSTLANSVKTNMIGEGIVDVASFRSAMPVITARVGDRLAGFTGISGSSYDLSKTCNITIDPTKQLTVFVVDYDTGNPIDGCNVRMEVVFAWQGSPIETEKEFVTKSDGKIEIDGLIAGMYARFETSCVGYHNIDGPAASIDYGLLESNGVKGPKNIELICDSSYQRAFDAAQLSMPVVSGMTNAKAMDTLIKHCERTKKRTENAELSDVGYSHGKVLGYLNSLRFPMGMYRNAIWELAESSEDRDVQLKGYLWLLGSYHQDSPHIKSVECGEVASRLVERFSSHPKMGEVALYIRSFHPAPQTALEKIVRDNPMREVRAKALEQLVFSLSGWHRSYIPVSIPDDVVEQQQSERRYLELIADKYGDLPSSSRKESYKEFADRRIAWLDKYGIGGTPPDLMGATVQGDKNISLMQFRGKIIVLHFWPTHQFPEFDELEQIASCHKEVVQLVGVAYGERETGAMMLAKRQLNWPILWDSHQGMVMKRGIFSEDPSGLTWGDEKVNYFKWYSTFVIDSSGKILAVGLTGDKLQTFVAELLARN